MKRLFLSLLVISLATLVLALWGRRQLFIEYRFKEIIKELETVRWRAVHFKPVFNDFPAPIQDHRGIYANWGPTFSR